MVCASAAKHTGVNCVTVTMADVGLERMATVGAIVELVAAPVRVGRTSLEVVVLVTGWLLGGQVGFATFAFAFGVGPLVQFFLPRLAVKKLEN